MRIDPKLGVSLVLAAACAGPVFAQTASPAGSAPASAPVVNTMALERLSAMGAYLRSLKGFSLTADVTSDLVLDSGQKIETANTVVISARMPDRFYVDNSSAVRHRQVYYDGKTVTIYAEKLKYYGTFAAPTTIAATLDVAARKYGLEVPLADLFLFGTDRSDTKSITEALYTGPERVGGVLCDQFAFRQPGVDWQVCIERGKNPLPRKLVVTSSDEPGQPQHRSVLTWKIGAVPSDATFKFVPPKGATPIAVKEVGA